MMPTAMAKEIAARKMPRSCGLVVSLMKTGPKGPMRPTQRPVKNLPRRMRAKLLAQAIRIQPRRKGAHTM